MGVKFRYKFEGKSFFGKIYRPVAKVSFLSLQKTTWVSTWMVVDSGADFTILPQYLSEDMGVSLKNDCLKDITVGVGGEQVIYLLKKRVTTKLGDFLRKIPLAFFSNNSAPPLLGRLGFLETFDVSLLKSHIVSFAE